MNNHFNDNEITQESPIETQEEMLLQYYESRPSDGVPEECLLPTDLRRTRDLGMRRYNVNTPRTKSKTIETKEG